MFFSARKGDFCMSSRLKNIFKFFFDVEKHERLKVLLLMLAFLLVIGGYTVVRTLKDSLFISIVGKEYYPTAKLLSIIILIPAILIFSKLVDVLRRHQLLYFYVLLYGIGGLIIAYYLGHPTIGLLNNEPSKYRIFGWIIYFFIEGYNPFVVSLLWSFTHSITGPEAAKTNYPLLVAASKLGGMLTAGLSCGLLMRIVPVQSQLAYDVTNHQILLAGSSLLLLVVPLVIYWLIHAVPGRFLHGYEAVYQVEKQRSKQEQKEKSHPFFAGIFSGLTLLIRTPYVMGIFGVIFFWEVVNVFVNYERLSAGQRCALSISGQTSYYLQLDFLVHMVGIFITLLGTRALIQLLGERKSLLLVPISIGVLVLYYLSAPSAFAMGIVFVAIRSINYAFASPLRESLYIPTTKEMKFKSKSWIDAFGVKLAKGVGAGYSGLLIGMGEFMMFASSIVFFGLVFSLWIITANLLGRRFEQAVEKNEVIGLE